VIGQLGIYLFHFEPARRTLVGYIYTPPVPLSFEIYILKPLLVFLSEAMSLIISCLAEIILQILQSCDGFVDMFSLIVTCKYIYSAWLASPDLMIWEVGRRSFVSFNDALMAVSKPTFPKC